MARLVPRADEWLRRGASAELLLLRLHGGIDEGVRTASGRLRGRVWPRPSRGVVLQLLVLLLPVRCSVAGNPKILAAEASWRRGLMPTWTWLLRDVGRGSRAGLRSKHLDPTMPTAHQHSRVALRRHLTSSRETALCNSNAQCVVRVAVLVVSHSSRSYVPPSSEPPNGMAWQWGWTERFANLICGRLDSLPDDPDCDLIGSGVRVMAAADF
jgi:hypothetical protein